MWKTYHKIIENQVNRGIVEKAPENPTQTEHNISDKGEEAAREKAETTKLPLVYGALTIANKDSPSLN